MRSSPYEIFPDTVKFVVLRVLVMITLPRTYKFVVPGFIPIPTFAATTKVVMFAVPNTFTLVVRILETTSALVTNTLP